MAKRKLLWQIYPAFLIVLLLSIAAVTWFSTSSLHDFHLKQIAKDLEGRSYLVQALIAEYSQKGNLAPDAVCKELGQKTSTRITWTDPAGKVLGDSHEDPGIMDNHLDRPEVQQALESGRGFSIRFSYTVAQEMMYVALPMRKGSELQGILRVSIPTSAIGKTLRGIYLQIALYAAGIAVIVALVTLWISRKISRPLQDLRQGSARFARGEFHPKLEVPDSEEIGALAEAMNRMAQDLENRIDVVVRQRNELEGVLTSMVEGVIAVDTEDAIINMNHSAGMMLGVDPTASKGKSILEVIRNTKLQKFAGKALQSSGPVEGEIELSTDGAQIVQAHGTALRDEDGKSIGALIVLNDVSRLKKLETVRRDFVANVSHELKTPITSIKGYTETLLSEENPPPQQVRQFLEIVAKHADRLNAIVEDLLSLSRIEQESERGQIYLEKGPLRSVLHSAKDLCQVQANGKQVTIELDCPEEIQLVRNAPLLEQAVVNLIDNAIKNSQPSSTVWISAQGSNGEVSITVKDEGCGIAREHLPRLFERFYRVDKARSRKLGGTGLGLAIVKHIVQAHHGKIEVESQINKGSSFTIRLPSR